MPSAHRTLAALITAALLAGGRPAGGEPLFSLGDEGRTFLYRAHPGDVPSSVALLFGVPSHELDAFLAANGITDATRVGEGFVYRIPNAPARELKERVRALEAENARLARDMSDGRERDRALKREAEDARAGAALAETRAARLARLESLWPVAQVVIVLLVIATGAAIAVSVAAMRRFRQAERYARALAGEVDEKRKAALAERQESARRVLDLETRIRNLEMQLGPRVLVGGR